MILTTGNASLMFEPVHSHTWTTLELRYIFIDNETGHRLVTKEIYQCAYPSISFCDPSITSNCCCHGIVTTVTFTFVCILMHNVFTIETDRPLMPSSVLLHINGLEYREHVIHGSVGSMKYTKLTISFLRWSCGFHLCMIDFSRIETRLYLCPWGLLTFISY